MQPTVSISFARHLSLRHARWENALASHEGVSPDGLPQIDGFQLERRIGQGRLACTFLARDLERGGRVVLKLLRRDLSASPARIAAFEREYAMLAALHHPHVVRVFGHSVMEGRPYLTMEYLGGGDLAGLLRSGLLPQEAVALLRQAGEAVAQLHRDGIVHCDVKPANLLLRHSGDLVLADSGSARRRRPARSSARPAMRRPSSPRAVRPVPRPTSTAWAWSSTRCCAAACRFRAAR
jgi:serine/threonine protein kinase